MRSALDVRSDLAPLSPAGAPITRERVEAFRIARAKSEMSELRADEEKDRQSISAASLRGSKNSSLPARDFEAGGAACAQSV